MSRGVLPSRTQVGRPEITRPTVSIVVPTFNEAENVPILVPRLSDALGSLAYEVIIVDDNSPDQTWRIAEELAEDDGRVVVIRRLSERGLSSAVLAGMAAARGSVLVAMDADLQHDESRIPELVTSITGGADVCLGTREADGGDYGRFQRRRRFASWVGAALAKSVLQVPVSDPMSGFFAVSRDRYELVGDQLNPRGFKILLEFLARGPKPVVAEVGYVFGERVSGATKLTGLVVWEYLRALLSLRRAKTKARSAAKAAAKSAAR